MNLPIVKQYFKTSIKTIKIQPICLPLGVFGALMAFFAITACETTNTGPAGSNGSQNARDLVMLMPMGAPTGEKLVVLTDRIPSIRTDLRYAKSGNVSRRRLYDRAMPAMLDTPTTKKLAKAQAALLKQGYRLKVWDAYRPPEAHLRLWRLSGRSGYVADPRWGWSKHCSGRAVDVTLTDAQSGREVPMPSKFDDFSKKASSNYVGPNPDIAKNLKALQTAMRNAGFIGIEMEWWHFENTARNQENLPPIYAEDAGVKVP